MGVLAGGRPLINPMHLGSIDGSSHVDPVEQLIAHLFGSLFHGQGQVLHSHQDFAGELLACGFEPKVVLAIGISKLGLVALVELPLVMECEFVGGANIWSEVTRVLFLSLNFNDNIAQILDFSLEFGIHKGKPRRGRD